MADVIIDAQALRGLRETRGWDQQTLAERAGVDPSVVSRLERGIQLDLKASVLVGLARALGVPADSLLVGTLRSAVSPLNAELASAVALLAPLSPQQQRQVAAILRGYLAELS